MTSVSLVVFFYNQRNFVQDSVKSAFSQSYEPLEIIFTDDCSTDGTFDEILRCVSTGPSRAVRTNLNERNLGLADHLNSIMPMAKGDLIVVMAGDDISLPHRIETLVRAWEQDGKQADCVHSDLIEMSMDGVDLHLKQPNPEIKGQASLETLIRSNSHVLGATAAYTPAVFRAFGPLAKELVNEDLVLPLRAAMLGGILYVEEPLVRHRVGGLSDDFTTDPETAYDLLFGSKLKWARWYRDSYKHRLSDMRSFPNLAEKGAIACCETEYRRWGSIVQLAELRGLRRFVAGGKILLSHPMNLMWRVKTVLSYVFPAVYAPFYAWRRRQRHSPR